MTFQPDYANLVLAARNIEAPRLPLYDHQINVDFMEAVLGRAFAPLGRGGASDLREFFRLYCGFFRDHGYDTVSFECCLGGLMPNSGRLGGHGLPPGIRDRADLDRYPWGEIEDLYFRRNGPRFRALRQAMPPGMKAVGGVGNGVFELAQDLVGFEELCYMLADDETLFRDLTGNIGAVMLAIWKRLLREYGDIFCVCRFGDDLGYKSATMFSHDTLRRHVFPHYKRVIDEVHAHGKPFLLHSCGNLLGVMEGILATGIDAKHSNEDAILPFPAWVERYGARMGNFGGIDTDHLCRMDEPQLREEIHGILRQCEGRGGIAFGTGNSVPSYTPPENYLAMNRIAREWREKPLAPS